MKEINFNVDNLLYPRAKKKALERGIVFEEYLWRLVSTDLSKGSFISEKIIKKTLDVGTNPICSKCADYIKRKLGFRLSENEKWIKKRRNLLRILQKD